MVLQHVCLDACQSIWVQDNSPDKVGVIAIHKDENVADSLKWKEEKGTIKNRIGIASEKREGEIAKI